jgi:hypothetical protein
MDEDEIRRASLGWTIGSLLGIVVWIGVTVYVAATNDDPSDPEPILRAFALGGAAFFASIFGAAAVQMRRRQAHVSDALYRRLAGPDVAPEALRAARKATRGIGPVYLVFGATTTALMLLAIGLGENGPTEALYYTAVGLVVVWFFYMLYALRRSYDAGDALLAPLGLRITEVPGWTHMLVSDSGGLTGQLAMQGRRHGRDVTVVQRPKWSAVAVAGAFGDRALTSPDTLAHLAGEAPHLYRRVRAEAGPNGIAVTRRGNGAGRHVLHDLLLAERLADATSSPG